ncbi:NAD(P)H-hydrate dehydratase [Candidatus Xianfuyuplasma coldseepsis]|uniref:Bifunctional NAD(P)H-hydrate repair enzyme n=1 Tax=Candidatus Xianfuyuplasma coldseepsis TaxID=2782163 RepID=A0A7L7KPU5_9MOLU|nr:NAD(P)H-hydrate dehydratase [Xianfuyuplasma coldseepsis]QMS84810.1 NAD(P)H-hydrate dehydratase [Xianfuyuplasma coldseepsis]
MNSIQILTANEMRQLDQLTLQQQNITSYELMTRVGKYLFDFIITNNFITSEDHVVVVAGTGNNGGDGMLVAHHIHTRGIPTEIIIIGSQEQQTEESLKALKHCQHIPVHYVVETQDDSYKQLLDDATVIIDGIFGIGLTRDVEDPHKSVMNAMNQSYATVISIDIPSGIHADNGLQMGTAVHANHTLIVQNFKQGNLLNDAKDFSGLNHVIDVDIVQSLEFDIQYELPLSYLQGKLGKRHHNSYKYNYGNLLTIGGSKGMMGAPILSALAALRSGSGLSQVYVHDGDHKYLQNPYPDIMVDTYLGIEDVPQKIRRMDAIVFGPGLGKKNPLNMDILAHLLSTEIPLVIDADGLYYLKDLLKGYNTRGHLIITPHYKEMADFLGISIEDVIQQPVLYAKNIAHTYNVVVVLKGTCTIITNDIETYFSSNGTPGLAKAGTGDVLSGVIGSLLGRGLPPLDAAKIGVLMHSLAGQYAEEVYGEESMMASDVISMLPKVMDHVKA